MKNFRNIDCVVINHNNVRTCEQTSKPQTNYRCCLRLSYLMPYWVFPCNALTFHKYFWCSRFYEFLSKRSPLLSSRGHPFRGPNELICKDFTSIRRSLYHTYTSATDTVCMAFIGHLLPFFLHTQEEGRGTFEVVLSWDGYFALSPSLFSSITLSSCQTCVRRSTCIKWLVSHSRIAQTTAAQARLKTI